MIGTRDDCVLGLLEHIENSAAWDEGGGSIEVRHEVSVEGLSLADRTWAGGGGGLDQR